MSFRWLRPYAPGRGRRLIMVWELAALAIFGWTTVELFELGGLPVVALGLGLAALWVLGCWRIARMGVYVSEYGMRVRGLLRSRTMAWREVEHIRLHQAAHRLGRLEIPSGMTVLIERTDGADVPTSLWAQGVDFHNQPGAFREVYHYLRERHAAALRPAPA
ncbi:PH domain-containing protein [Phytohabitans sp. ZYX-F-186]|uniref:PH domain-containing protein n=1 Tax=Phytohabitans maris TaxID=3071409 RepID=A0ABU0ZPN5_9ACTN|nr:PH domain-containing protein [Phytohabitans sp. ZYX-F-186]MDQ7908372.1 PH domain-containing protein [Phytohabitans sp. ZYX-F-186]